MEYERETKRTFELMIIDKSVDPQESGQQARGWGAAGQGVGGLAQLNETKRI